MFNLLTKSNIKTLKGESKGYQTWIMHLLPSDLSGFMNTCPKASAGCRAACLNTAGHGGMFKPDGTNVVQEARRRRTRMFYEGESEFLDLLYTEIAQAKLYSSRKGFEAVFRLNGTSDILWEKKGIIQEFADTRFYDYTKIVKRKVPSNYHLTFSRSEDNAEDVLQAVAQGMNVAVVFDEVPETYMGLPVIKGDEDDLRFLDPQGVIVGLTAKGRARKDFSGFVVKGD